MNHRIVKDVSPVITNLGNGLFSAGLFCICRINIYFNDKKAFEVGKIGVELFALRALLFNCSNISADVNVQALPTPPGGFWK